jgi:hypothetical protein
VDWRRIIYLEVDLFKRIEFGGGLEADLLFGGRFI